VRSLTTHNGHYNSTSYPPP